MIYKYNILKVDNISVIRKYSILLVYLQTSYGAAKKLK